MGLEHAILTALSEKSGSGYELARRFDKSIGYFWNATHQQIYRVLKRMGDIGWVSREDVAQHGRPDKFVYSVSPTGRRELSRWVCEATDPMQIRSDLGVKLRAARTADVPALLESVARHRDEHQRRLDAYRHFEKRDFAEPDGLSDAQHRQYLVLRGGILAEESLLAWCDEILTALSPRDKE